MSEVAAKRKRQNEIKNAVLLTGVSFVRGYMFCLWQNRGRLSNKTSLKNNRRLHLGGTTVGARMPRPRVAFPRFRPDETSAPRRPKAKISFTSGWQLSGHEHKYDDARGQGFFGQTRRERRAYPKVDLQGASHEVWPKKNGRPKGCAEFGRWQRCSSVTDPL